jgi:hypothetical protein
VLSLAPVLVAEIVALLPVFKLFLLGEIHPFLGLGKVIDKGVLTGEVVDAGNHLVGLGDAEVPRATVEIDAVSDLPGKFSQTCQKAVPQFDNVILAKSPTGRAGSRGLSQSPHEDLVEIVSGCLVERGSRLPAKAAAVAGTIIEETEEVETFVPVVREHIYFRRKERGLGKGEETLPVTLKR